jgi:diaminopimelate decarboxylase
MQFLSGDKARELAHSAGTPLYVYSREYLENRARQLQGLCRSQNWIARYAVKANPHPEIIRLFDKIGLYFDASSEYEAELLVKSDVRPETISLSSQQPPKNMKATLESGVKFVATSLHQLELVSQAGWRGNIAVRLNPGMGSGHNNRTTTGGLNSSFGVWHEYLPKVLEWQQNSGCGIDRIHVHIGSGADPQIWRQTIQRALELVEQVPSANVLDIGGGFKVARLPDEKEADMASIINVFTEELQKFRTKTGRDIKLEIEPGTWLVANAGIMLAEVIDVVDTGKDGHKFIKLNTGMNDFLRPALYGAQHPIEILNDSKTQAEYLVVGHNCESGDLLTPAPGDPESLSPRLLNDPKIGDLVAIGGVGAYGASMRAQGYNSFPSAEEILI